jgi:hypothetical protein
MPKPRACKLAFRWETSMGLKFLKIAVVYLVVGGLLGFTMGISQKFALAPATTTT